MSEETPAAEMPEADETSTLSTLLELWTGLRRRLRHHGLHGADADDCMQDTALRILRSQRGDGAASPAFVRVVARNARVDWLRRHTVRRRVLGVSLEAAAHPTTEPRMGASLDLAEALARLPAPFREVVELSTRQGLGYAEIAQRLGLPLGTVKSRMSRALAALRKDLGDD